MTNEEMLKLAQEQCEKFNRMMKPIEDTFMAYATAYKTIGYGRMIQLINEQWRRELDAERIAYIQAGEGKGYSENLP